VLLAALPQKDVVRLIRLKGLPRLTPHTLVSRALVLAELERVRRQGYAIDNQEN
jgi:DNA-binding IclR family transcriptional regulator